MAIMKKIILILFVCSTAILLAACNGDGDKTSYSVTIRNASVNPVVLKTITVNGRTYLSPNVPLAADDSAGGSEVMVVFSGGRTVNIVAEIHDEILSQDIKFAEQFTDKSGEGYAILLEYGNGGMRAEVNRVGRLSAWGGK